MVNDFGAGLRLNMKRNEPRLRELEVRFGMKRTTVNKARLGAAWSRRAAAWSVYCWVLAAAHLLLRLCCFAPAATAAPACIPAVGRPCLVGLLAACQARALAAALPAPALCRTARLLPASRCCASKPLCGQHLCVPSFQHPCLPPFVPPLPPGRAA